MFPLVGGAAQPKTDPAIYSMGFRNPFRLAGRRERRRLRERLLAGRPTPAAQPRARRRRVASRSFASRRTTATRCATRASSATTSGTTTSRFRCTTRPSRGTAAPRRSSTTPAGTSRAARANEIGLREIPPVADPIIWYSYNDNQPSTRWGRRASATTRRPPAPSRLGPPPSARGCSPSCTPVGWGRTGSRKYNYDPANPNPLKFPPYYDESVILGEFTQDTLREMKLDANNQPLKINSFLNCGAARHQARDEPVRVRQPDGHAVRLRRRLLPADLRRRVLRHQRRRRHVQVAVRQGHAMHRVAVAQRRPDRRPGAADGELLQRRFVGPGPGRLDHVTTGTSATAPRTRSTPTRRTPTRHAGATRRSSRSPTRPASQPR